MEIPSQSRASRSDKCEMEKWTRSLFRREEIAMTQENDDGYFTSLWVKSMLQKLIAKFFGILATTRNEETVNDFTFDQNFHLLTITTFSNQTES